MTTWFAIDVLHLYFRLTVEVAAVPVAIGARGDNDLFCFYVNELDSDWLSADHRSISTIRRQMAKHHTNGPIDGDYAEMRLLFVLIVFVLAV